MDGSGSPLYGLTWKTWDMPSGEPICALRASARRTSGNGSTGERGWPTPMAGTPAQKGYNAAGNTDSSRRTVELARGWPTPLVPSGGRKEDFGKLTRRGETYYRANGAKVTLQLDDVARMTGWSTPTAQDHARGIKPPRPHDTGVPLSQQAGQAGWPTVTASCANKSVRTREGAEAEAARKSPTNDLSVTAGRQRVARLVAAAFVRAFEEAR